jgi:3-phosphoshikimate 1-carboxyvinyltransferase
MSRETIRKITPVGTIDAVVRVPPSKSYTNRALIVTALADGASKLVDASNSDDSEYLIRALRQFGVTIERNHDGVGVQGTSGKISAPSEEVFVGNAGTAMRFLTTFASLAEGISIVTGDEQMQRRPLGDLLEALHAAGIKSSSNNGCPPVKIHGGNFTGGRVDIRGSVSSQFVSSILLSSPYAKHPVTLCVQKKLISLPYVDMTLQVMRSFGAKVDAFDSSVFAVSNADRYVGQTFRIEGDATCATYFLAAAAILQGRAVISNLSGDSLQGDLKFLPVLAEMGCRITHHGESVELQGGKLFGVEVDMNEMPDCVPTLAVIAAFAKGPTTILNIAHLRFKETDRIRALAKELSKIGAQVDVFDEGITIHPGNLRGATIETYNDHRMAMSFAVAGLRIAGIGIENPTCVSKSFPNFWEVFGKIENKD